MLLLVFVASVLLLYVISWLRRLKTMYEIPGIPVVASFANVLSFLFLNPSKTNLFRFPWEQAEMADKLKTYRYVIDKLSLIVTIDPSVMKQVLVQHV